MTHSTNVAAATPGRGAQPHGTSHPSVLVMLDGTTGDPRLPTIRVNDLGLTRGDGVFETVLFSRGQARELTAHLERLARSAALLDLPEPDRTAWERCVHQTMTRLPDDSEYALKLVYTRGVEGADVPTGYVFASPIGEGVLRQRRDGVAVVTLERGIDIGLAERAPWLLLGAKSLSYALNMAAIREARRRGADDALFTATDGSILEGPTATVVVAHDRTLRTTPPHLGILPGTTQAALYRAAAHAGWDVRTEPLGIDDLRTADGVFLISSTRKVARVHTLNGESLRDSSALHEELSRVYESQYSV